MPSKPENLVIWKEDLKKKNLWGVGGGGTDSNVKYTQLQKMGKAVPITKIAKFWKIYGFTKHYSVGILL